MHQRIRKKARWLVNCDKWDIISVLAEIREEVSFQITQDLKEFVFYSKNNGKLLHMLKNLFRFTFML